MKVNGVSQIVTFFAPPHVKSNIVDSATAEGHRDIVLTMLKPLTFPLMLRPGTKLM